MKNESEFITLKKFYNDAQDFEDIYRSNAA